MNLNIEYSIDDKRYYQLPPLVESDFNGKPKQQLSFESLPQKFHPTAVSFYESTKDVRFIFEDSLVPFKFQLPPPSFTEKLEFKVSAPRNMNEKLVAWYKDVAQYGALTEQQFEQIYRLGEFDIPSKSSRQPYTWKLTRWLIKGSKNNLKTFMKSLTQACRWCLNMKQFLIQGLPVKRICGEISICHGFCIFFLSAGKIPGIFLGSKETLCDLKLSDFLNQAEAKRQQKLRSSQQICPLYQYLWFENELTKSRSNQQKEFLQEKLAEFDNEQKGPLQQAIEECYASGKSNYLVTHYDLVIDRQRPLQEQLYELLFQVQVKVFRSTDVDPTIVEHVIRLAEIRRILNYHRELIQAELEYMESQIAEDIEKNTFVLKNIKSYTMQKIKEAKKDLRKKLKSQYGKQFEEECLKRNLLDYKVYMDWNNSKKQYLKDAKEFYEQAKMQTKRANIVLKIFRRVMNPYVHINGTYSLNRYEQYTVTSSLFGWRVGIMCIQYCSWSQSVYAIMMQSAINGQFGVKALCLLNDFPKSYTIDSQSGNLVPSQKKRLTVVSNMKRIYKGMRKSREEFENTPSYALCGKGCLRICNLIEVYIFRFLFVGIFINLMCFPIAIIFSTMACVFIAITVWVWMPFIVLLRWMFCAFILDLDGLKREKFDQIKHANVYLPLFTTFLTMFYGLLELFLASICAAICPMMAALRTVYGMIVYMIRSFYDCCMMGCIRCCASVPMEENCLAWKIRGPHFQGPKEYVSFHLKNSEVQLLLLGELERCILTQYQKKLTEKLRQPQLIAQAELSSLFKYFNAEYHFTDQSSKSLEMQLNAQIEQRLATLPKIDQRLGNTVNYTRSEIDSLKQECIQFLEKQIFLKNMSSYVWQHFGASNYGELLELMLKKLFGKNILSPIDDVSNRVVYEPNKEYDYLTQVQRALKGQGNLNRPEDVNLEFAEAPQKQAPLQKRSVHKPYVRLSDVFCENSHRLSKKPGKHRETSKLGIAKPISPSECTQTIV